MTTHLGDLPAPPSNRTGWPWTIESSYIPSLSPGKHWPRITIITPSYNQGRFLEETIRSVLLQGYPNLEYIIIDGGSTDDSVQIIQKYARFLSDWISEPDGGQANAINKGFARSTGEIMGWLNSDDILFPTALFHIAKTFVAHPHEVIVTGFRKVLDDNSNVRRNFIVDLPTNYYMEHYCCVAQETTYWHRRIWEKLGPLDETFHFALDYEYWLRIIHDQHSIRLIPHFLGGFRDYPQNKSSNLVDVYHHDLEVIHKRYRMGASENAILKSLGPRWPDRFALLRDLGFQKISNYPRVVIWLFNLLEIRVVDAFVINLYRRYRIYRPRGSSAKPKITSNQAFRKMFRAFLHNFGK